MGILNNLRSWTSWGGSSLPPEPPIDPELQELAKKIPPPLLWLFGKTGSGKSSIVRYLTASDAAKVGAGFRPETKYSQIFDFPESDQPLLRFLDTRGVGEPGYDPEEDISKFHQSTQMVIVTVRVTDHALDPIIVPLKRIRQAYPDRFVLLVLTCLHHVPGAHQISSQPYAFEKSVASNDSQMLMIEGTDINPALGELIQAKLQLFAGLVDQVIPVDLTNEDDGFDNANYGGPELRALILDRLPHAYRQALIALREGSIGDRTKRQRLVHRQVLASSALAASAGAIPLPYVDIPAVLGIQTHLAYRVAAIHKQQITSTNWAVFSSAAGTRIVTRLMLREALKIIPVAGMAVSAAGAFAFTYALGMSWDWYFSRVAEGEIPTADALRVVFAEQLSLGRQLWETKPK